MNTAAQSITDVSLTWPSLGEVLRVLLLQAGFNSAVVVIGTTFLGMAAGIIGTFALLRKRALMSDALSHAALPGLCGAFLLAHWFGVQGKSLPLLLAGATVSGVTAVLSIQFLTAQTRLGIDTAIGIVLSVFFGAGIAMLSGIQSVRSGDQGGLQSFIYGQTAAMHPTDAMLMAALAGLAMMAAVLLLKEFRVLCFDQEFAQVQGWPVSALDLSMMALVVLVTVVGLQSVGIILVIAMVIVPAASARFWTEKLSVMTVLSGVIGAMSGYLGATFSSLLPRLPAGAVIVLTAGVIFLVSFFFAPARGLLASILRQQRLRYRIASDHLLREIFETVDAQDHALFAEKTLDQLEQERIPAKWVRLNQLATMRGLSWFAARLLLGSLKARFLLVRKHSELCLTSRGWREAVRLTRNHRLWEEFMMTHADLAASHVDRSADMVEHVLSQEVIEMLEGILRRKGLYPRILLPSRHPVREGDQ